MSKDEISLLAKGDKFIPIDKGLTQEELETYGRKFSLMWYYCNEERVITFNRFKKKSKFNPKRKDAAIEIYLNLLFSLDKKI